MRLRSLEPGCVSSVEMRIQTMILDQLQKIRGIEKKEDRSKNRTLRDAAQHRTRGRRGRATVDRLCATIKLRREPCSAVESRTLGRRMYLDAEVKSYGRRCRRPVTVPTLSVKQVPTVDCSQNGAKHLENSSLRGMMSSICRLQLQKWLESSHVNE